MTIIAPKIVRHEMRPGEQPLWIGYPNAMRYASIKGLYWFLVGIPWTAFAVFAEYKAATARASLSEQHSMAILLILSGLAMVVQPFWHYWRSLRIIYVVTHQRLLVFSSVIWLSVESYYPPFDIEIRKYYSDSGSLIFSRDVDDYGEFNPTTKEIGLFAIPDVREVKGYIMQIKQEET